MLFGDEVLQCKENGIPPEHIPTLVSAADKLGAPFGFRSVNYLAQDAIRAGDPPKSFHIKNKSAPGLLGGRIAINPLYSREDKEKYADYIKKIAQAKMNDRGTLLEIPYVLDEQQINTFKSLLGDNLKIKKSITADGKPYYLFEWKKKIKQESTWKTIEPKNSHTNKNKKQQNKIPTDEWLYAKGIQTSDGKFALVDETNQPIMVLGRQYLEKNPQGGDPVLVTKPITCDYDLLVICFNYNDLDLQREHQSPHRVQGNLEKNHRRIQDLNPINIWPKFAEHPDLGNLTEATAFAMSIINNEIALKHPERNRAFGSNPNSDHFRIRLEYRKQLLKDPKASFPMDKLRNCATDLICHNMDVHNPYAAQLEENLPILFVMPTGLQYEGKQGQKSNILMLETLQDIQDVTAFLSQKGYYWPSHAKHHEHISPFQKDALHATQKAVQLIRQRSFELVTRTHSLGSFLDKAHSTRLSKFSLSADKIDTKDITDPDIIMATQCKTNEDAPAVSPPDNAAARKKRTRAANKHSIWAQVKIDEEKANTISDDEMANSVFGQGFKSPKNPFKS